MVVAAAFVAGLLFALAAFEAAGLTLFFVTADLVVEDLAVLADADVFAVGLTAAFTELVFALVFTAAFLGAAAFTAVFLATAGFARAEATFFTSVVAFDADELTETFFF